MSHHAPLQDLVSLHMHCTHVFCFKGRFEPRHIQDVHMWKTLNAFIWLLHPADERALERLKQSLQLHNEAPYTT
jgi:hypothetical protein